MWEYKTEICNTFFDGKRSIREKCDAILKKYADEGWEFVTLQCSDVGGILKIFIFKKEKK
ncbi:MAG: DUF4177 domain-containing protein [Clostridium sp.]